MRLSASQLGTFKTCSLRWWLTRVDEHPDPTNTAGLNGSAVHDALEAWERSGRQIDPVVAYRRALSARIMTEDLSTVVVLGRGKKTPAEDLKERQKTTEPLVRAATDAIVASGLVPSTLPDGSPAIEVEFEYETAEGNTVKGFIDVVMLDPGRGVERIRDYKTGRRAATPVQLLLYRDAWSRLTGRRVSSGEFFYTKDLKIYDVDLERWAPGYVDGQIDTMASMVAARHILPSPGDSCSICPVRAYCPDV